MTESRVKQPRGRSPLGNLLTIAQVAQLKGCRACSVHEAIMRGDLRAWRFGSVWAVPKKEAQSWVLVGTGHRKKPAPLTETNPHIRDPEERRKLIEENARSSSAIEGARGLKPPKKGEG